MNIPAKILFLNLENQLLSFFIEQATYFLARLQNSVYRKENIFGSRQSYNI